jgi:hypothetical protein
MKNIMVRSNTNKPHLGPGYSQSSAVWKNLDSGKGLHLKGSNQSQMDGF